MYTPLKIKLSDKSLFGNDAGEDEVPEVLDSYFIDLDDFQDFYDPNNRLCVVSARKGMGKSALLSRLQYKLETDISNSPIVVKTTGNDLLGLGEFEDKDQAYLENYWRQIICKQINIEIGKRIGFAFTHESMSMVEAAELEGIKNKNIVGALITRIQSKIPLLDVAIQDSVPSNWKELLSSYNAKNKNTDVWLLIDDIDAKFINSEEYQIRVSSFFSAIRSLATDLKNLKIRSTVRSDVWNSLSHIEDLDKWEQYIIEINWTRAQLQNMLAKRIHSYVRRNHPNSKEVEYDFQRNHGSLFKLVFTFPMRWGNKDGSPFVPIKTLSNNRPRWMGQLCRMAAKQTHKTKFNRVGIQQISDVMETFGKFRKNDLIKEHDHQFSDLDNLIDAFRAGKARYKYTELTLLLQYKYIVKRGDSKVPDVDSFPYSEPEQLGAFLYKIGFLSNSAGDSINFTNFCDDPDLFTTDKNRNDELIWEVHPSYRTYLRIGLRS
ncbi:hypothetical protein QGP82_02175 [Leptothoe sp. LEGE 181152]|nr:hypothetical protein [Leptothoe sp. LEGE 181152]